MRNLFVALVVCLAIVAPTSTGISQSRSKKTEIEYKFAAQAGTILGAASACPSIARPRIKQVTDTLIEFFKFRTSGPADFNEVKQSFDFSVAEGRSAVEKQRTDCIAAERELSNWENIISASRPAPQPAAIAASPSAGAASGTPAPRIAAASSTLSTAAARPASPPVAGDVNNPTRGVTAEEIRFGISAPFSGPTQELGNHMRIGIEAAFRSANANGGVHGRLLRLVAADDGYEPIRTASAMKQLYETDQVFGVIGNVGTPTALVALPFALERKMLFYGAFTGADLLRRDPPDRYVFNYRASYAEETDAVVRYLVKVRQLRPEQIAVFTQQDAFGDAGFAGVQKAIRSLRGGSEGTILRLNYKRNTTDVEEAVARLRQSRIPIKAVVMVATYRAAARFIARTRDTYPDVIYTNVSFVGSTALAKELMALGPRFANGVIVTQVVPAVGGYSTVTLEYKAALATHFPGEVPDYVSFEGYLSAKVLVEALKRAGPQPDTEKVVDALESLREVDIGLGALVNFSRTEHQGLHKVWGTQLDTAGQYQPIELQ
jgi:branched-chain amino acid transport system substrate-binding protein